MIMETRFISLGVSVAVSMVALMSGCDSGGSDGPSAIGPNLNGEWEGEFYRTDDAGDRDPISASVTHEGTNVTVRTSRKAGVAVTFTGAIDAAGNLYLIDGHDGEAWTTHDGPATPEHLVIEDFTEQPPPGSHGGDTDLFIIDLSRKP